MRLIDANTIVTCLIYDDEYEERFEKAMTIADYLDEFSNEGCPPTIEAVPVRKGENLSFRTDHDVHNYQTDGKRGRVDEH